MLVEAPRWGQLALRSVAAVAMVAGIGLAVLLVNLFLILVSWKTALAFDAVAVVAAPWLWSRASGAWLARAAVAGLALTALSFALVARPIWVSHSRHDARLSNMVDDLCNVDLPSGAEMSGCEGSITNTGNGNSCRYLVAATVVPRDPREIEAALEQQGIGPTSLDIWGDPNSDGMTYTRAGARYNLWYQSSWEPSEDDIRCT